MIGSDIQDNLFAGREIPSGKRYVSMACRTRSSGWERSRARRWDRARTTGSRCRCRRIRRPMAREDADDLCEGRRGADGAGDGGDEVRVLMRSHRHDRSGGG